MNSIDTVFEWLLATTLRASVLAVVILGIQFVFRRRLPAAWRYALWLPMLAVLVLPALPESPFGLFPGKTAQPVPVAASVVAMGGIIENTAPTVATTAEPVATAKLNYLAIAWFTGACGVLAAGVIGYRRNMRRIQMSAMPPDQMLQATIVAAAGEAGLKRAPRAVISAAVASPAVTGLVRPLLLLPAGFPESFSAAETRLILLHEFSHLKRLDLPLNWLMCVLQAMHWFNPLLWFAFARMRADRELACDARVLSIDATDRRAEYGGALLKLQCAAPTHALSLGFVGIFERDSEIHSRIRGISAYRRGRLVWKIGGCAIVTLLLAFGVTKGQQSDPPAADNTSNKETAAKAQAVAAGKNKIQEKLDTIIIPKVYFENTTLEEAINFLRQSAEELDVKEPDPARKGINFVVPKPLPGALPIRELRIRNVPLAVALKYICDLTEFDYTVDSSGVTLAPKKEVEPKPAVPEK